MTHYVASWDDGVQVRWRSLTWSEYRKFRYKMLTAPLGVSLEIYQAVAMDGPDLEMLPAGIARYIADDVLKNSPFSGEFSAVEAALQKSRAKLRSTYLLSAQALICHMFRYTLEEVESWGPELFFERLAMAEFIAGKPLDPVIPALPKTARPRGNLWQQERQQREDDRGRRFDPVSEAVQPRQLTPTQAKAIDRARQARRGG